MPDIPLHRKPDGTFIEAQADADGALKVAAEVTGADGAELAREDGGNLEIIAGIVTVGFPLEGEPALNVRVAASVPITTIPDESTLAASAAEADGQPGQIMHLGSGVTVDGGFIEARQGSPGVSPWLTADAGVQGAVEAVDAKLGTLAAQEATTAKDTSVDGLEALSTSGNASLASVDAKLQTAMATAFATPVRGTATAAAAQLASQSWGRGFVLENIDTANDLYVGPTNAVTTANGFRISPSRSRRFDVPNPNGLWVISASTTAYQLGATT